MAKKKEEEVKVYRFFNLESPNCYVWDKENNKILVKFDKGKLVTGDKRIIEILLNLGYKYEIIGGEE